MKKLKMHTPDMTQGNVARIRELFPNCVTEAKDKNGNITLAVDFDALRQELSANIVEGERERYRLDWPGKKEAMLAANAPIAKTLRPCREESVDFDTTQNLFIEGDNLDALKLLQESYLGKVKMIYIDPPYNTGNDFIYKDDFSETTEEYLVRSNQKDETGRLVNNTENNGRFHSDWLSMMYPRLKLARNLLSEDGVIFISIDDNEIFGSDNYINIISLKLKNIAGASGGGEDKRLKKNMEFIILYSKNYIYRKQFNNVYNYTPVMDIVEEYRKLNISWKYTSVLIDKGKKEYIGSTFDGDGNEIKIFIRKDYIIKSINQIMNDDNIKESDVYNKYSMCIFQTAMPQSSIRPRVMNKIHELGVNGDLFSIEYTPKTGRNKDTLYEQFYKGDSFRLLAWLHDVSEERDGILYKKDLQGTLWDFVNETKNLSKEGDVSFPNGKKPIKLIMHMLKMLDDNTSIILDFFAGSSSTAHAVMQLNAEDGGNRRFIMVQLPEVCDEKSEAAKAGYKTIAEISKERIRRAGKKIKEELAAKQKNSSGQGSLLEEASAPVQKLDTGFRVLKVDSSNMNDVFYNPDAVTQKTLMEAVSNIKYDRSDEDLLFQVLLDWGVDLSLPVRREKRQGKTVFVVDESALVACFDRGITEELVQELAKLRPLRAVFRDDGFASDAVKINVEQIFRQISPGTLVKSL